MSVIQGTLLQNKISAGGVASFGQSLRTFVPQFQVCPPRGAFDQYGRDAAPQSINTQTCPGGYPALARIDVENSLRPFISPLYFNLPIGISGGSDTLFGRVNIGRPTASMNIDEVPISFNDKNYTLGSNNFDRVANEVGDMAAKFNGNVMVVPDFNSYNVDLGDRYKGYSSI
jgi:hypothetical protein